MSKRFELCGKALYKCSPLLLFFKINMLLEEKITILNTLEKKNFKHNIHSLGRKLVKFFCLSNFVSIIKMQFSKKRDLYLYFDNISLIIKIFLICSFQFFIKFLFVPYLLFTSICILDPQSYARRSCWS